MQIIMVNKSVLVKQEAEDTGIISNTIAVGSVVKSEEGSLVPDIFGAIIND